MATPEQDVLREMAGLLLAMTDAKLDDTGRRRLAQLVREEPDARRLYLDYCQMHALLRSAHGVLTALEPAEGQRRRRVRWMAVGVAVLALAATLAFVVVRVVWPASGLESKIAAYHGDVQVLRYGQRIAAAAAGPIRPGERVLTGADGTADVRLTDGTTMLVDSDTDVGFEEERNSRQVSLKTGMVRCEVASQRPERPLVFQTPHASQRPERPLVFQTPHAELTVLGTACELTATPVESRVRVLRGRVRWTAGGRTVEVAAGALSTADAQGLQAWQPVCDLDFGTLKTVPPQLETVYCDTQTLHTADRKVVSAPNGIQVKDGGLQFGEARSLFGEHGLLVSRWRDAIGSDVALEVDVASGVKWSLGIAVDGDSFAGYRIIFAAPRYPNGIELDSLYPAGQTLLAQDPRPISAERDHTLRVEKQGERIRVWVDRELRIDTVVAHPLARDRQSTVALSNFGESPLIRRLRVWKATGN
jgi:ferric-dicitrate binding protein FerR (iron transport regulator)